MRSVCLSLFLSSPLFSSVFVGGLAVVVDPIFSKRLPPLLQSSFFSKHRFGPILLLCLRLSLSLSEPIEGFMALPVFLSTTKPCTSINGAKKMSFRPLQIRRFVYPPKRSSIIMLSSFLTACCEPSFVQLCWSAFS